MMDMGDKADDLQDVVSQEVKKIVHLEQHLRKDLLLEQAVVD
jgi:hypothetical protein